MIIRNFTKPVYYDELKLELDQLKPENEEDQSSEITSTTKATMGYYLEASVYKTQKRI